MAGTANDTVNAQKTVQYDLSGVDDPTLIATTGAPGTTYRLLRNGAPKFYIKVDEGTTTNWLDLTGGGAGLTGAVNLGTGAQILKNILLGVLQLRSVTGDTTSQVLITQNANDIKVSLNTNEVWTPVQLTTVSAVFETIYTYAIPLNQAEQIGIRLVGRKQDGTEHCVFERLGLFHNEAGTAVAEQTWHSKTTIKSDPNLDIRFQLSGSSVIIQVKSLNSDTFYWKGQVYRIGLNTL